MKKYFFLFLLTPLFSAAQDHSGFVIRGTITGYPDGTNISFYQQNSNHLDSVGVLMKDTFYIKGGHLEEPELRNVVFGRSNPVIPILLKEGDEVVLKGTKDDLAHTEISGAQTAMDHSELVKMYQSMEDIFLNRDFSPENLDRIGKATKTFVEKHPDSYASLLAISQLFQLNNKASEAESLLKLIGKEQQNYQLTEYLKQQVEEAKLTDIGTKIMSFSQNDTSGHPVSIEDFKGKYVLIDFWASWCGPCRMENPNVVANYNRFKDKGFTVLGVSLDRTKENWLEAIRKDHLDWTHVSDLKYWNNAVSRQFHIYSIPRNLLIDPNGIIVAKNLRGEDLGNTLEEILLE